MIQAYSCYQLVLRCDRQMAWFPGAACVWATSICFIGFGGSKMPNYCTVSVCRSVCRCVSICHSGVIWWRFTIRYDARPGGFCDMRSSRLITDKYYKKEAFPLVKCIIRQSCRIDRWSFRSWIDVNRSTFWRRWARLHFRSQWPWPLTSWS